MKRTSHRSLNMLEVRLQIVKEQADIIIQFDYQPSTLIPQFIGTGMSNGCCDVLAECKRPIEVSGISSYYNW